LAVSLPCPQTERRNLPAGTPPKPSKPEIFHSMP
jgi:hypothetical protein